MPVEIKELHIRVAVSGAGPKGGGGKPADKDAHGKGEAHEGGGGKEAIVAECVEQVLQILQAKKER
ncbi:MAG TPA: DUF5908 family protein [Rhizomicrobium sp.]|jgi:hypothetical protein|nr:DUF5908 family protein [Rhizomicrobium sp.]